VNLSKYQCPKCQQSAFRTSSAIWTCQNCTQEYPCVEGIPKLYLEELLGEKDKELRDKFYNGFVGSYYQQVMPFLSLPARPARAYWKGWLVYVLIVFFLVSIVAALLALVLTQRPSGPTIAQLVLFLLLVAIVYFFYTHSYLFYLIILAVPVKLSLLRKKFRPALSFGEIHDKVLREFLDSKEKLQVLDISTGTCNSLYRHGWMKLNAEYTGLDLSETMLLQGQKFMKEQRVPIDFVLGDATRLPFQVEKFDIVLNYGALNGFTNPQLALEEMARVTKQGGLVLFLDEQLYEGATSIERLYFKKVLSSHNVIHRCPLELIPASMRDIALHQVYQFYYICTCVKA